MKNKETGRTREDFLREAEDLINGERARDYGPARKNHERIADIWSVVLQQKQNTSLSPEDVVACMIGLKLARLSQDITKDDSWRDIIGYAALGGEMINDD